MATGGGEELAFEAVVLAAGAAERFGGGKLVSPYKGGVLLDAALAIALAPPVRRAVVVTGSDAVAVQAAVQAYARRSDERARLTCVHAADHRQGMGASLATGVGALSDGIGGAFVFLGDMPRIPHDVLPRLADALTGGALAAAPSFDGRRGHPVLFAAPLLADLRSFSGRSGARRMLETLGSNLVLAPTNDPGVLLDVDYRDDLRSLEPGLDDG